MRNLAICEPLISAGTPSEIRRGIKASLPVMLGFIPFALVLGAQARHKGFSPIEVPLMTGLNFGGGSEFAAVELWTSPPHVMLIIGITFLINSRHLLMGATFAPFVRHLPKRQAFIALFFMCDESWAMSLADAKRSQTHLSLGYFSGVAGCLYATWVVFTTLGSLLGPILGDVTQYGFDMAFPAVFLVMLAGMWRGVSAARPWAVSLIVAGAVRIIFPGAWYVPAGAISGIFAAAFWARAE